MKKKRWLPLLMCVALLLGMGLWCLPVPASAETEIYPLICVSTTDGGEHFDGYQNAIPMTDGENYVVLLPQGFYQGDDRLYLALIGEEVAELTYMGETRGYTVMNVDSTQSQYFFQAEAEVENGKTYTLRGITNELEQVSRSITVGKIGGENSDGWYPIQFAGDTSGIQPLAAIVDGNKLVAIAGADGTFAGTYNGEGENTEPTAAPATEAPPETEGAPATEAPTQDSTQDPAEGPARPTEPKPETKPEPGLSKTLIIVIAVAAGLVLVGAVVLLVRGKTPKVPVPPAPPVPPYVPVKPTEPVKPEPPASPVPPEPPKATFHLYLVAVSGPNQGKSWEITEKGLLIGRNPDADVLYPADTKGVSRRHCQVFIAGGSLSIMDLSSTSGTYIRGKGKLMANTAVQLQAGDIIYLGSKEVALELVSRQ